MQPKNLPLEKRRRKNKKKQEKENKKIDTMVKRWIKEMEKKAD